MLLHQCGNDIEEVDAFIDAHLALALAAPIVRFRADARYG